MWVLLSKAVSVEEALPFPWAIREPSLCGMDSHKIEYSKSDNEIRQICCAADMEKLHLTC